MDLSLGKVQEMVKDRTSVLQSIGLQRAEHNSVAEHHHQRSPCKQEALEIL